MFELVGRKMGKRAEIFYLFALIFPLGVKSKQFREKNVTKKKPCGRFEPLAALTRARCSLRFHFEAMLYVYAHALL